jgi:hypothetical protein
MKGAEMAAQKILRVAAVALAILASVAAVAQKGRYWEGRPDFVPGEAKGYFIWNDANGWHLRWSTKGGRHIFAGTVTCDGLLLDVKAVSREKSDFVKQTSENTIRFDAKAAGDMDGVDFRLSPSTQSVSFDLRMDGQRVAPEMVRIGHGRHHPESVPFGIKRNPR